MYLCLNQISKLVENLITFKFHTMPHQYLTTYCSQTLKMKSHNFNHEIIVGFLLLYSQEKT